ncbi:MAG: hypothetical protein ACLFPB_07375 [Desulfovermiculus sp.]
MLASKNLQVHLWVRHKELLSRMQTLHENSTYLPGIRLSQYLEMSSELQEVLAGTHTTVLAVPSQHLRQVLQKARSSFPPDPLIICATKGIETKSCKTVSQLIEEELKDVRPRTAILSGPHLCKRGESRPSSRRSCGIRQQRGEKQRSAASVLPILQNIPNQ